MAQLNVLCDGFGLDQSKLRRVLELARASNKTVTLRFDQRSTCECVGGCGCGKISVNVAVISRADGQQSNILVLGVSECTPANCNSA